MAVCKIYMVDHSNELFDSFKDKFKFERLGSSVLPDPDPTELDLNGCLYVVHTNSFREEWLNRADKERDKHFLFISRNVSGSLPDKNNLSGRTNCHVSHIKADELSTNKKFKQFIADAREGKFNWELLLQDPYPEYLVAAYLLDVAMTIPGNDELKTHLKQSRGDIWEDIEERAKKEFQDRGGQEDDWLDIGRRVAAVRELFSRIGEQRIG